MKVYRNHWLWMAILFFQSGCSLFLGNIRPIEEKSTEYGVFDLSKANPDWKRLDPRQTGSSSTAKEGSVPESGIPDMAFQSQETASIVSVNSVCKSFGSQIKKDLKTLTQELLLGISKISHREQKTLTLEGTPALQTTVHGRMGEQDVMLRAIVIQKSNCVYDLMYISRPDRFKEKERDFKLFVTSLKLK